MAVWHILTSTLRVHEMNNSSIDTSIDEQSRAWRNYHALMKCTDRNDPVPVVIDQLGAWLREKKIDVDLRHDNDFAGSGRSLEIRYHERDRGHDVSAVLVEQSSIGQWRSAIMASPDGWVEIAVSNSQGRFVKVPRIAKYLMQAVSLGDVGLNFVDHAETWNDQQIPDLVELLTEPLRHAPVFVAAMGDETDLGNPFIARVNKWIKETYGLAQTIILTPNARRKTVELLQEHAVKPWSIRTYLPGVGLGDSWDSRRHRYLQTATLAGRPDGQIIELLGGIAREQSTERLVSPEIARVHRAFERLADQELTRALRVTPFGSVQQDAAPSAGVSSSISTKTPPTPALRIPAPKEASAPMHPGEMAGESEMVRNLQEQLDLVRSVFGINEITHDVLRPIINAANATRADPVAVEKLEQRMAELREQIAKRDRDIEILKESATEHEINAAIAEDQASKAVHESRWLRQKIRDRGNYEAAHTVAPEVKYPEDMSAVVDSLPNDIEFTGTTKDLNEVVERDSLKVCARVAWDAVCAMSDYLSAKEKSLVDGSFHDYVKNTPSGFRGMAPAKSAENETGTTKDRFGTQRVFRVPTEVHPDGAVTMSAHIKLGRIGMASPRMHYHHDARSGRIFIGYIGLHLTNTMS